MEWRLTFLGESYRSWDSQVMGIKAAICHVIGTGQEKSQLEWAGLGIAVVLGQVFINQYAGYKNKPYKCLF